MKKILSLLITLPLWLGGMSQVPYIQYQGELQTGYIIGLGANKEYRASFHIVNSMRLGDYFSAGAGTGLDLFPQTDSRGNTQQLAIPVYFNAGAYYPLSSWTELFFAQDVGISFGVTNGITGKKALVLSSSVGVRYFTSYKNAFTVSFGYVHQKWTKSGSALNTNGIQFKFGYTFY